MSIHTGEVTPRKPSGSSSHSVAHSPASSPNNVQSQRKLAPGASAIFGVAMPGANGINGLNNAWPHDSGYRGGLTEGWTPSRPTSGTWDVDVTEMSRKDADSQQNGMGINHGTPRQPSFTRIDDRTGQRSARFSPKRYENGLAKDGSRYPSSTIAFGTSSYPSIALQPPAPVPNQSTSHDAMNSTPSVDDLAMALRGMVVEDDQSFSQFGRPVGATAPSTQVRPPGPQVRPPYNGYVQGDYPAYYSPIPPFVNPGASQNSVYPNVAPGGLHPNTMADMHRQHYYEYNAQRPGSQFYYPSHQALLFPASNQSPMLATPQLAHASPVMLNDKKREMPSPSYPMPQQMTTQNMLYASMRSTPSPHPQAFPRPMEYGPQLQMMLPPGSMYGAGSQPVYPYAYGAVRTGRRSDGDAGHSLRSPLLEEFRVNKTRKWELRDIFGYVVEFSGDQHGSRFIQQKLENATSEEKQVIFDEIVPNSALQLVQDVFGNYVIQKLFEHGTQVQKSILASTMEGHIVPLSLQMYGCRVVQKAVECILPDQQAAFVRELDPHVLKCVKDANGNHVIQKLIERVSPERLGFVKSFRGNVYDLATHPYGCRVLQRCLEHLPDEYTKTLFEELHNYTIGLMQDQFGNYVIQFVLEHGRQKDKSAIMDKLRGQLISMARHKFASNVCEKALVAANPEHRRALIEEMYTIKPDGTNPIITMMKDQYANYVLQRALVVVDEDQREILINKVRPNLMSMRRYSSAYNKHLVSIERLLEKHASTQEHGHDSSVM